MVYIYVLYGTIGHKDGLKRLHDTKTIAATVRRSRSKKKK